MGKKLRLPMLPVTIGLCPVHYEEFYLPVERPSRCPAMGCTEELVLYDMAALTALVLE